MASEEAIKDLITYLDVQGYRRPDGWGVVSSDALYGGLGDTFRNVSNRELHTAARVYVASGATWWPNAGQLLALIPPSGPPLLGWAAAWGRARKGMPNGGTHKPPGLKREQAAGYRGTPPPLWRLADRDDEHEAAMVAIASLGWKDLCGSDSKTMNFAAKTFERVFKAELARIAAARQWTEASGGPRQLTGAAPRQLTGAET